ncbi:MAG: HNH endonuclease [Caulobacter sp.]|nr:HNH endonuclease [Caulobacter sp.]
MRYWWVSHRRTAGEEIAGRFLWAPRREGLARNQTRESLRIAAPGDLILSYAGGLIGAVGRVADHAFPAPRPAGFGHAHAPHGEDGWRLPVVWTPIDPPVRPAAFFAGDLAPLLPARHSPLNRLGRGEQKAYLSEIGEAAFRRLLRDTTVDLAALDRTDLAPPAFAVQREAIDDAIAGAILADPGLTATQKQQLVTARKGQGIFRERVLALEPRCRVTGVTNPWLLIASHIKPWRSCETAAERLDGANGLMLTPDVDRLFDRGMIGFGDEGAVLVSPALAREDLTAMGLAGLAGRNVGPFTERQAGYLDWHRRWVFVGG